MKKTLYLNCFSGISGDMMLGLLLDLLGKEDIYPFLKGLALEGYVVEASRSKKGGISGVDVSVRCDEKHCHRGLKEVLEVIEKSDITPAVSHKLKPLSGCLRRLKARSMECPLKAFISTRSVRWIP